MTSLGFRRRILAMAILRIPRLRSRERFHLWDLIDDELSLSLISPGDIEAATGRRLHLEGWSPEASIRSAIEDFRCIERLGGDFIHYDDDSYPFLLRQTCSPPFGLFVRGGLSPSPKPSVAIVGTRMPTGRGIEAAYELGFSLSERGVCVVSGLARGIDSSAHRGALSARLQGGEVTCAVLPCGIDAVYPPSSRSLAAALLESGCPLVSEYPPGTPIHRFRFPERNRIVAGMSSSCVVVEAPDDSGALITANHALDEGRDVWVVSHCLGGPRSMGIDALAYDGAKRLASVKDLVDDLCLSGYQTRGPGSHRKESHNTAGASQMLLPFGGE